MAIPILCYIKDYPWYRLQYIDLITKILIENIHPTQKFADVVIALRNEYMTRILETGEHNLEKLKWHWREPGDAQLVALVIEESCYRDTYRMAIENSISTDEMTTAFIRAYCMTCCRVTRNLDPHSEIESDYLISQISNGAIDPHIIGTLTSEELSPDKTALIRQHVTSRMKQQLEKKMSTQFKCPNCGKYCAQVYQKQYRSLDEGAVPEAICLHCHHKWRVG